MPFLATSQPPSASGNPGYAVPLPLVQQGDLVNAFLARDRQQYDPYINNGNWSYDYSRELPHLNMYVGLSGARAVDQRFHKGAPLPTFPRTIPPTYENEVEHLNMSVGVDPGIYSTGIAGIGIPPKRLTIAPQPQQVSLPLPPPVLSSTKVAVIGGSVLFVGASIALFLYMKSKKGGK